MLILDAVPDASGLNKLPFVIAPAVGATRA